MNLPCGSPKSEGILPNVKRLPLTLSFATGATGGIFTSSSSLFDTLMSSMSSLWFSRTRVRLLYDRSSVRRLSASDTSSFSRLLWLTLSRRTA